MKDLGVDADHQGQVRIAAGDMLGCIAERFGPAELFKAHQIRKLLMQSKEQIGFGLESIIRAVVDDRRQIPRNRENPREMTPLGRGGTPARKYPRDDHQPGRSYLLSMRRMGRGDLRILRPRSDNHRHAGRYETCNPLLTLPVGQKRPIPHRAAVNHRAHPKSHKFLAFPHQSIEVRLAVLVARGHQRRNASLEYVSQSSHLETPVSKGTCKEPEYKAIARVC